jgi:peptidoglycan/LPS O-acetylase OafA/YrhL
MGRRLQRIYPTFLVIFLAYIPLAFLFPDASRLPDATAERLLFLLENLLLLPGLFVNKTPLVSVAWTLSYEMFYYALIPCLIGVCALRARTPRFRVLLAFCLAVTLVAATIRWHFLPLRLVMFIAGILLFETIKNAPSVKPAAPVGVLALLAGLVALAYPMPGALPYIIKICALFVSFYLLCLTCFASPNALSSAFSATPLRWLGNISYSYYLVHSLTIRALFVILPKLLPAALFSSAAAFWVFLPVAFAATLLAALLLYLGVERPLSLKPKRRVELAPSAISAA